MPSNREQRIFAKGKYLFRAGDPAGDLIFIASGEVALFKVGPDQNEIEIARVGAGDILGVMTILQSEPRTASARAETDVTVDIVPRDQMEKLMATVPKWLKTILKDLIGRVNIANAKYVDIATMWEDGDLAGPSRVEMACQIAEGVNQFNEVMAKPERAVNLSEVLPRVESVLGYRKHDFAGIIEFLQNAGFLSSLARPAGSTELADLKAFAQFAKDLRKDKSKGLRKQVEFPAQDRRKLLLLVGAAGKLGLPANAPAVLSFNNLTATMDKLVGRPFDPLAVEAASQIGLVAVERNAEGIAVRFVPGELELRLRCIDLFRRLELGESQAKSAA